MPMLPTPTPARLLVVEDEPKLAEIIAKALTGQGYEVQVTGRGDDALRLLVEPGADWALVVLDRMLPGLDGVTVCSRLRAGGFEVPVLMLTALDEVDQRISGLDAGANDYLAKPFALKELYARIRALLRTSATRMAQDPFAAPERLTVGDLSLEVEGLVAFRDGTRIDLRPKETAILASLMRRPDRVVARWVILEEAWGDVDVPSANHLDVHIGRIRHKVDRAFGRASIETVRGAGYRIRNDGR